MQYYTKDKQEIILKQRLDVGGEGAVWLTNLPETVAKVYHNPTPDHAQKVAYMVENPPKDPMAAKGHCSIGWPQQVLEDADGHFQGFLMTRVSGALKLDHIYNAKLRRRSAPGFTWHYLHVASMNVASILAALHHKNYVVGDLKTDNFLVTDRALVSIIDTDSFQIATTDKTFACPVGSEGFMPPELIGVDLAQAKRTPAQDNFGLGILVHLLLLGYHPFSGEFSTQEESGALSRDEAIANGYSLYAKDFHGTLPPYVVDKAALFPSLREAFVQCFDVGLNDPEKRPTAQAWQDILQTSLREMKQCSRQVQHFYFGSHCFWCDRLEKTGVEVFAKGDHVRTLNVDLQMQKAIDTQDLREMARLWQLHQDIQDNPRFQKQWDFIKKAIEYVETLDHFKAFCETAESDEAILSWWLEHDALSHFPHNPHERINNRPVHEFLKDVRERSKALDALKHAIQQSTHMNKFGALLLSEERESAILKAHDDHRWPETFRQKNDVLFQRVEAARHNLEIWQTFESACGKQQDQTLLDLWKAHHTLLEQFPLSGEQRQLVVSAEKSSRKIEEIQTIIKSGEPGDRILAWWGNNPRFQQSAFRHEKMDGLTIEEYVTRAKKQKGLLDALQMAASQGDFQQLASLWDPAVCEGQKEFSYFAPLVKTARENASLWQKVKRAAQEEEQADVLAHWDERQFAVPAHNEGLSGIIRRLFRDAYGHISFPPIAMAPFEQHRDFTRVRWGWPAHLADDSLCVAGITKEKAPTLEQREKFRSLYTVRKRGDMGDVMMPGTLSKGESVYVWAAQMVCGELLTFGDPLEITPTKTPRVSYKVRIQKRAWRGWRKKFGPRVDLTFTADQSILMPALSLKRSEKRPLVPYDEGGQVVLSVPGFSLAGKQKKTVSFFLEEEVPAHAYYRLDGEDIRKMTFDFVQGKGY